MGSWGSVKQSMLHMLQAAHPHAHPHARAVKHDCGSACGLKLACWGGKTGAGRGQDGGRDGRGEPADAYAGARLAALQRRNHTERVPRARGEGRRLRAPLPAGESWLRTTPYEK